MKLEALFSPPKHCCPSIRTLDIIILNIAFVFKFIASVTTGMNNVVDVLDQTFAKINNMFTVVCCVKRLDLFCTTYSHPPTLTCECIIFLRFNTSEISAPV